MSNQERLLPRVLKAMQEAGVGCNTWEHDTECLCLQDELAALIARSSAPVDTAVVDEIRERHSKLLPNVRPFHRKTCDTCALLAIIDSRPIAQDGARDVTWGNVPLKGDWYVPGWYFQRRKSNGALQIVEINYHGLIWRIGASDTKFVVELKETGDYEWLGPISHEFIDAATEPADSLHGGDEKGK